MSTVAMSIIVIVAGRYPVVVILLGNSRDCSGCLGLSMLVAYVTLMLLLVMRLLLMYPTRLGLVLLLVGEDMLLLVQHPRTLCYELGGHF